MKFLPGKDKIDFNEEKHLYSLNGENFTSVSSLIHLYAPKFDESGEILERCALKKGISPEELRKQWDYERDSACDRGHILHKELEYWIEKRKIKKNFKYKEQIKQISNIPFKGKLLSEITLYSVPLGIAGTSDIIEELDNKNSGIWDMKQNKKLSDKSFYTRGQGYSYMFYPINHLMNCNMVHYALQLSLYQILLEESGYKVQNKTLIYAPPKETNIQIIPLKDLKKEAEDIINHFNF